MNKYILTCISIGTIILSFLLPKGLIANPITNWVIIGCFAICAVASSTIYLIKVRKSEGNKVLRNILNLVHIFTIIIAVPIIIGAYNMISWIQSCGIDSFPCK
jgi:hypothetical protein